MDKGLRRIAGVVLMVAGIACAAWLVFGAPHDWDGDVRLVRMALGLAATGVISGGARLIFWQPKSESVEAADVA
ncbi:hypothetical protein M8I34_16000 [Streptomyces sp. MCA2]|uniref:hypothetical protein n=1 Tax=Streptomyces sp. MCA2 TaxID=2944805 RepID=UPI00201FC563|nr:hypothetical protein [Streptomyces sp. MCA2]MCL7492912.1 hypothetical protein [Streptomyces sp. MCA2]